MAESKIKPVIEDIIDKHYNGDMKQSALDFVAHLRLNKMSPGYAGYAMAWDAKCKGKTICKVSLGGEKNNQEWNVMLYLKNSEKYENTVIEEGLQDCVWDNVTLCGSCDPRNTCTPEDKTKILIGKEVKGVCRHWYNQIRFWNPNGSDMYKIKRLLELEQQARKSI